MIRKCISNLEKNEISQNKYNRENGRWAPMVKRKKSKEERIYDREIVERYHQKIIEDALAPLYESFQQWKTGQISYNDLTEKIHEFHNYNKKI